MAADEPYAGRRKRLLDEAEAARQRYAQRLRELAAAKIAYHHRAPEIPQHLLDNCRLIQNRHDLVGLLPKNGTIAEIGTDRGLFARFMLETCKPRQLHLFKRATSLIETEHISEGLRQGIITIHEGEPAPLLSAIPDDYFDWIYVDGDHSYDGVRRTIEAAAAKVKPGGHLVFNDYTPWSAVSVSRVGVARAVNEFCIANEWELVLLALQSLMYNDVAVRRPAQ